MKKGDAWDWAPSDYVEKITQDDPTHISFTLKPGFKWSGDSGEVTAEDVKFSLERMLKSDWAARYPTLDKVDVKDKLQWRHRPEVALRRDLPDGHRLGIGLDRSRRPRSRSSRTRSSRPSFPASAVPTR